jgi:cullin-4
MPATQYVEWLLEKVEEERERALVCLDADVAEEVVAVVRKEGGKNQSEKVVSRGECDSTREVEADMVTSS